MATKEVTVQQGQSLKDIALQEYGHVDGWWKVANLNNMSMTAKPVPGTKLIVDDVSNDTTKYLADGKHVPATLTENLLGGIGYMQIGTDFKVS